MTVKPQTADCVVMARPRDFGFNEETGLDNEFQTRLTSGAAEINRRAGAEFQRMVDRLRAEGIQVLILEPTAGDQPKLPDAVFPNNWFSTEHDGTIIVYPMRAPSRRAEQRVGDLERLLRQDGRRVGKIVHIGSDEDDGRYLEGTGSLVIDHARKIVYAVRSARSHPELVQDFVRLRSYGEGILFTAVSSSGRPLYHTNVMMSVGTNFLVRTRRVDRRCRRAQAGAEIARAIAGRNRNLLGADGKAFLRQCPPASQPPGRAARRDVGPRRKRLHCQQRSRLGAYGKIVSVDLDTIETVGGGSARCMLAEIFSPRVDPSPLPLGEG